MMGLVEDIQAAVKAGKAVLGFRQSLKVLKSGKAELAVLAGNAPSDVKKAVEQAANAGSGNTKVETFEGTSTQLGIVCGKSFPVSTLAIKK